MFKKARVKLTFWYLLIIMLITLAFSVVIFEVLTSELDRVERIQRSRTERNLPDQIRIVLPPDTMDGLPRAFYLDPDLVVETKNRLIGILTIIDLSILSASAIASYFLAGRTLKPISEMVDEQNRFIADASHELRTPLTSLKSEIEVNLRDKKLTLLDAKNLLNSNLEEVNNLQILSDDLIKLAQYQKGANGIEFSEIDLSSAISEAVKKVTNIAKTRKIEIINKVTEQIISGNKTALTELFVIFLDNAIKYSHDNTQVIIASQKTDGHIIISVSDSGIGINEKDIPHLFDRFYRAEESRSKTQVSGYGLGLSIARQIVDKHHGSIAVKSEIDKGTEISIKLPIRQAQNII